MDAKNLTEKLEQISNMLETGTGLIAGDSIVEFQDASRGLGKELEQIMQEGRELRLGIVGEVKAGKSSFLNALLFDGQDILPKAPTPMTAALTRISYGDVPEAKIVFYSKNDWDSIECFAKKYNEKILELYKEYEESFKMNEKEGIRAKLKKGIGKLKDSMTSEEWEPKKPMPLEKFEESRRNELPMEHRACKEVFDMAGSLDVGKYLGKEHVIKDTGGDEYGYLKQLDEYVGVKGKYTPIVKYTVIRLCNEMLKGIEVIDTPGMNDPILSRSRITKKFLINCDAVFLLGYCGQFLSADEMEFLMSSLPGEGIHKAVLIGSKMDAAILTYPRKNNPTFEEAYVGTRDNCEAQALGNIKECSKSAYNEKLLSQLEQSLPPYCTSSLAYSAARQMQKGEDLGAEEKKIVDTLCRRFSDFTNDAETLLGLSSIPDVRQEIFEKTKRQKDQIIQERIQGVVGSQAVKFKGILEDIYIQVQSNRNDVESYDCEQLKEQLDSFKEKLDSVRSSVKNLFEEAAVDAAEAINEIETMTGQKVDDHSNIDVEIKQDPNVIETTTGWWLWQKKEKWVETIHTHTATVNNAYDNIRKYRLDCIININNSFKNIFDIKAISNNIKETVMEAFDQTDRKFDEKKILMPLETALREIRLPDFEIALKPYEEELDKSLGGIVSNATVKNENIPLLLEAQRKVLEKMSLDIERKLKEQKEEIRRRLQNQASDFIDNIIGQLEGNQKKLEGLLKDKEASLRKLDAFLKAVSGAKETLRKLEG